MRIGNGSRALSPSFRCRVAKGDVPGWSFVRKYGACFGMQAATGMRDIWEFGSPALGDLNYTFPADGTAPIDTVSSSSASDTGPIVVQGLDINGELVTQTVTLAGQAQVSLSTPLWRCFRAYNDGDTTTPVIGGGFAGNIYIYENTTATDGVPDDLTKVRAFVSNGYNQTLMALYTIPAGKIGFLVWNRVGLVKKGTAGAILESWQRNFGKYFRIQDSGSLSNVGTSTFAFSDQVVQVIPALTDIVVRGDVDTNDTGIAARFSLFLQDDVDTEPQMIPTPQGQWTKVASSVVAGRIIVMDATKNYRHTIRDAGDAPPDPVSDLEEGISLDDGRAGNEIANDHAIDVYVYCDGPGTDDGELQLRL